MSFLSNEIQRGRLMSNVIPRKKPLYLDLADFKLIVSIIDDLEERIKYDNDAKDGLLTQEELALRSKVQTIISYIERARLREVSR
jgi:hypothetical protein